MSREFAEALLTWFDQHGRHDLPWQHPRTPYRVWVSEVMLQQTQVSTVIGYFERWMQRFPDLKTLAAASLDEVLACWSGLGYYARARNLKRAADECVARFGGVAPEMLNDWLSLPGVGPTTAAAIMAQAFGAREAILDGNVKRVLSRLSAQPLPADRNDGIAALLQLAQSLLPKQRIADYTQALMDLGATLCTQRAPRCGDCPVRTLCLAQARQQQAQFPIKSKRLKRSSQRTRLLILEHGGEILLETRPARGIWGGLKCFPQADPDEDLSALIEQRFGAQASRITALPSFVHVFTHIDLTIEPVIATLDQRGVSQDWLSPNAARLQGLPKPVRHLLDTLYPTPIVPEPT